MALTKIRQANRKWKHEKMRRERRRFLAKQKELMLNKKRRIIAARREQLKHREGETNYVNKLVAEEVGDGKQAAG